MRSLLIPLLSIISALPVNAQSIVAQDVEGIPVVVPVPPKPGRYVGIVTITKDVAGEALSSKVTLKAYATVKSSGDVTILTVVPESPKVAMDNPESTLSRAVRGPEGFYLVDGKYGVGIKVSGDSFQFDYSTPLLAPRGDGPLSPDAVDAPALIVQGGPTVLTRVHYRFYPQVQPRARKALVQPGR